VNPNSTAFWNRTLAPYKKSDTKAAVFQLLNTGIPFALLWYLMLRSLETGYALTLLLGVPAAGLLIRLFIIQHDCGHGSFLKSQRANNALGFVLGVITLTPYQYWRRSHSIHHATSGNLDRRDFGEVDTWTVEEYLSKPLWRRWLYRVYRHPFVLLVLGPFYQFVLKHRLPFDAPRAWKREWLDVMWTNLALAGIAVLAWQTIGLKNLILVQAPITLLSGTIGIWLFYVQHQFEDTYWERQKDWDFKLAGLQGSSYYDLPVWLHWFTGNIGYHHIHHLASQIPNYRLRQCFAEVPELQHVTRLTIRESLRCIGLKLWDEKTREMVGFSRLKTLRSEA